MKKPEKLIICRILFAAGGILNIFFSSTVHYILSRQSNVPRLIPFVECLVSLFGSKQHFLLFLCLQGFIAILCVMFYLANLRPYQSDLIKVTPDIETPAPVGQNQHGSSRWMTDAEKDKTFASYTIDPLHEDIQKYISHGRDDLADESGEKESQTKEPEAEQPKEIDGKAEGGEEQEKSKEKNFIPCGGVVLGMTKEEDTEKIYFVDDDTHTLTIGATRSGKTRSVVLQSICTIALAGESLVISDPKAELYQYSAPFLRRLGYKVVVLDLRRCIKCHCHALLKPLPDQLH